MFLAIDMTQQATPVQAPSKQYCMIARTLTTVLKKITFLAVSLECPIIFTTKTMAPMIFAMITGISIIVMVIIAYIVPSRKRTLV